MSRVRPGGVVRSLTGIAAACCIAPAACFAQPCAPVRLDFNGSFESPTIAANSTEQTTPIGWTWINPLPFRGFVFNGNLGAPWPLPPVGSQFLDVGNTENYGIEQAFTIPEPRTVNVSWRVAQGSIPARAQYQMKIISLSMTSGGVSYFDSLVELAWAERTTQVRLPGGNYKIRFQPVGTAPFGPDTLIDDVKIEMLAAPFIGVLINPSSFGCPGRTDTLSVDNLFGLSPLGLTWSFTPPGGATQTIVDGFIPGLGTVSGAGTPSITISNIAAQVNTQITCTLSNACGSIVAPFQLSGCIADFNCSGSVTVQDIFDFLAAWFAGSPAANVNGVAGVTVQDIFDFLSAWFFGC